MKTKYYNKKTCIDGIEFDSLKEARRYQELKLMERAGMIKDLKMQVRFELIPAQYEETERVGKNGQKLKPKRRIIEYPIVYIADFTYTDENGDYVCEDTKGFKTKDYILKRKLMLWVHGIRVREV